MVPMLDDSDRICDTVMPCVGCEWESEYRWSATCSESGTCSTVSGATTPSSRAAASVITLLTEPGSYIDVTARSLPVLPTTLVSGSACRDRPAFEVALDEVLPLLAGQLVVVAQLEPRHARVVEVDAAEQRARQVARRVQAGRLVDDQHAGDVEVGDALGHVVVDLAGGG